MLVKNRQEGKAVRKQSRKQLKERGQKPSPEQSHKTEKTF
jgi:hypothetical protein